MQVQPTEKSGVRSLPNRSWQKDPGIAVSAANLSLSERAHPLSIRHVCSDLDGAGESPSKSNRDGQPEIDVVNADRSSQVRLTDTSSQDRSPAFSHDGLKTAFVRIRVGNADIYGLPSGSRPYGVHVPSDHPHEDHARETEREQDDQEAAGIVDRSRQRLSRPRSWAHRRPVGAHLWRIGIALIGLVVVIVGVVLLVLPGPGWVTIFVGLGIWATEFVWAKSLLTSVQRTVRKGMAWIRRQPRWLTAPVGGVGLIVVAAVAVGIWLVSR